MPVTNTSAIDYDHLSVAERIQLVEDIWDSIATEQSASIKLTETQRVELHRRVAAHRSHPSTARTWQQIREKLYQGAS